MRPRIRTLPNNPLGLRRLNPRQRLQIFLRRLVNVDRFMIFLAAQSLLHSFGNGLRVALERGSFLRGLFTELIGILIGATGAHPKRSTKKQERKQSHYHATRMPFGPGPVGDVRITSLLSLKNSHLSF